MKYLIVALGNKGDKYTYTRHNIGWLVCDALLPEASWEYDKYADALTYATSDALYVKPQTMMNLSGHAVRILADRHHVAHDHIVVLHDDLDIFFGSFKISYNRGAAGNNGVHSIARSLGGLDFVRVRIGISRLGQDGRIIKPPVLGRHPDDELQEIPHIAKRIASALAVIIAEGHAAAMNRYNEAHS